MKRQLVGNPAALVPPAWRIQHQNTTESHGSKIIISKLPIDVQEPEIDELFKKTVGPLKDSFIVYNSQGRSKGMAVVSFLRPGDAAVARQKYHGKIVDGRRPIRIEIVIDSYPDSQPPTPSLLTRLGTGSVPPSPKPALNGVSTPSQLKSRVTRAPSTPTAAPPPTAPKALASISPLLRPRFRRKKGPRRVKKSLAQLDKEMEEYRAASDLFKFDSDTVVNGDNHTLSTVA